MHSQYLLPKICVLSRGVSFLMFLESPLREGSMYSSPPLIRTPLLPTNSVLFREVSFGEREHHMQFPVVAVKNLCPL